MTSATTVAGAGIRPRAVTAVARGLKLRVSAQGVETAAQLALLERLGCTEAQGFHLGPPVPPSTLADQLGARPARPRPGSRG